MLQNEETGRKATEVWRSNLISMWFVQFFCIMGLGFAHAFAPFYLQELGVTGKEEIRIWSGLFQSGASYTMIIVTPIWGYLADRIGKKPMSIRATLGGALSMLFLGLVQSPQMLIVIRIIQGIFTGTVTANLTLVVAKAPKERMGFTIGVMNSAVFVGSSISPLLGGVLADLFGYRASFFVASALLCIAFLTVLLFVKEGFQAPSRRSFSFFSDVRSLVSGAGVLSIIGLVALFGFTRMLPRPILPLLVQEIAVAKIGLATQAGFVITAGGIASLLAGVVVGSLADRSNLYRLGAVCAILGSVTVIPLIFFSRLWQVALSYFVFAFFIGGVDPILKVIIARLIPPERRGAAFGLMGSAQAAGWGMGAVGGGITAALMGLRSVFVLSSVMYTAISGFLLLMGRRQERGVE